MSADQRYFIHPDDAKALDSLKSIPGFSAVCHKFMDIFSEREYRIINMASKMKLSEEQLPEVFNMLPPVCEKLGIEVPDLYLEMDPFVNAYTFGDTKPFITIKSGALDYCTDDELRAIIAHECGHIACHHTLYKTMANFMLGVGASIINIPFVTTALKYALLYWNRCSEFSADRAGAYVVGGSDTMVDLFIRLSGATQKLSAGVNKEMYLQQATEYKQYANSGTWNKILDFCVTVEQDHPLNAVRALEITKWCDTDDYRNMCDGKPYQIPGADSSGSSRDKCPKCNMVLSDDTAFCPGCGIRIERCKKCGAVIDDDDAFCEKCGTKIEKEIK